MYASRFPLAASAAMILACAPNITEPAEPPATPEIPELLRLPKQLGPTLAPGVAGTPVVFAWDRGGYPQFDTNDSTLGSHRLPVIYVESIRVTKRAAASTIHPYTSTGCVIQAFTKR